MKKKYTIQEIAKLCGTSKATVSRVLNNPDIVSAPLRKKIQETMEALEYTPNPFAQTLGTNGMWGIALFVFDILNPFFALMVREIGKMTMANKIPLTVCDTENNEEKEEIYLDYLLKNKIGGIIFSEGISHSIIDRARQSTPVVLIDQYDTHMGVPEVTSDNFDGAKQAVEHLVQLNHRRIGFVAGPESWTTARERFRGFRQALMEHDLPYEPDLVYHGDFLYESGISALEYFLGLKEWPTAVVCANDQMALGIINKAHVMNISIPNDMSIIGFDGLPLFGLRASGLTTVKQDVPLLCKNAVDMLMDKINHKPTHKQVIIPTQLTIGNTCQKIGTMKTAPPLVR